MKKFSTAIKYALVGFTLFNTAMVFAAADSECVIQPDGSCLKVDVTGDREPGGGLGGGGIGSGGGGGGEMGGGGGSGSRSSDAKESNETIVTKYKLPCKNADESNEVFTANAIAQCTATSTETALSQNPILRLAPNATRVQMLQLCTAHVTDLVLSNKIQSC
jgi:hypothetical protein